MQEGIDYCFIYPKDDPTSAHVRLLTGNYASTVFKFGKVKFEERDTEMYLVFQYDVLEASCDNPKKLEQDENFRNYIGNLLVEIMAGNLQQDLIDETIGTDNTQELDL